MDAPAIAADDPVENAEKHTAIVRIGVDHAPIVSPRRDVVEAAGHEASERTSHSGDGTPRRQT